MSPGEKVCITARGSDLSAMVIPEYRNTNYFLMFDPVDMKIEAVKNCRMEGVRNDGEQTAQWLAEFGVKILLTGHVDSKERKVLHSFGICAITGIGGTARDVYNDFVNQVSDVG
jgi:predicted Fe-Mo cluster-binding NifX family protein